MDRFKIPSLEEFSKENIFETKIGNIVVKSDRMLTAINSFSRLGVHPNMLVYLPPTMSPGFVSDDDNYLEHPKEIFEDFKSHGVNNMIAQEKHMGSRATIIICKDEECAEQHFGVKILGEIYSKNGNKFFKEPIQSKIIKKIHDDLINSDYFNKIGTDFFILDCEIKPWNIKAKGLIRNQYASTGYCAILDRENKCNVIKNNINRFDGDDRAILQEILNKQETHLNNAYDFKKAYEQYCWVVNDIKDLQISPFHLLATEGKTYFDKTNEWHMNFLNEMCNQSSLFSPTKYWLIKNEEDEKKVVEAWINYTENGGEGFVIKPEHFMQYNSDNTYIVQPALKVRGRKYLRIIYGIDYLDTENLKVLKEHRNVKYKRINALKQFILGYEALNCFVNKLSLVDYHRRCIAILGLDNEPLDPRL